MIFKKSYYYFLSIHKHVHHTGIIIGVRELAEDLDSVAVNWKGLGLQLGIKSANLNAICGNQNKARGCFTQTLETWLESGNPTHDAVIKALRSATVGHNTLARKLDTKGIRCLECGTVVYLCFSDVLVSQMLFIYHFWVLYLVI